RRVRSPSNSDLDVPEARRRRAVRDVRALTRLTLAAVRQPVQPPGAGARDSVETPPELRSDSGVGRIAQHAAEPPALDLPRDLGAELKVEALVVDRPAPVRLHVDAVVDVREQIVEVALAGLEVEIRHAHERHAVPAVRTHRSAGPRTDACGRLARGEETGQQPG